MRRLSLISVIVVIGAFMLVMSVSCQQHMSTPQQEHRQHNRAHTTYTTYTTYHIIYKDGTREEVKCESYIYGTDTDNIYFISDSGKDTVKVVPKVEVEEVQSK